MSPARVTSAAPKPLLPPGAYWCSVVSYADGSGLLNVYGPYASQEAAEQDSKRLKSAGVHPYDGTWEFKALHLIDLGTVAVDA